MTSIKIWKYNLPDSYLSENNIDTTSVKIWIPDEVSIILGRSNNPKDSLHSNNVITDKIPVYKRQSGGETVILSPNTLIISLALKQTNFKGGKSYFEKINNYIINALKEVGIKNLRFRGISDIAINRVKILGSAIYQNKDVVFYHAVLNISESTALMERYIKHPSREPDYRKNRNHDDFVTSLVKEGYDIDTSSLISDLENNLSQLQF